MFREDRDEGEIAITLVVIEAITDHELIRDIETNVFRRDLDFRRLRLSQDREDLHTLRTTRFEVGFQPRECQSSIKDVFDDQDLSSSHILIEVFEDPHHATRFRSRAIGGDRHPIHLHVAIDVTGDIGHRYRCTFEDADHQEVATFVILRHLVGEFLQSTLKIRFRDDDAINIRSHRFKIQGIPPR